tara:strand:- start:3133 stop:3741 length:609 start_codon:yes stop_codon:yes gene_type:complete
MKFCKLFFLLILYISLVDNSFAQGFEAKIFGGINSSQLQGDNLSGFDKIGLHTGLGVEYGFLKNSIGLELIFNQKGSASKNDGNNLPQRVSTTLNYLQIPVLYSINSWYNETNNFYHIGIHAGPYFSTLFSTNSSDPGLERFTDNFRKTDFGAVFGFQYRISHNISSILRYDQSFLKIYNNPSNRVSGILSYLVTLRLEYYF